MDRAARGGGLLGGLMAQGREERAQPAGHAGGLLRALRALGGPTPRLAQATPSHELSTVTSNSQPAR